MNHSAKRSCQGKVRHRTHGDARKALAGSIRETGDLGLTFYFCRHCRGYHVGHPSRREQATLRTQRMVALIDQAVASDIKPQGVP